MFPSRSPKKFTPAPMSGARVSRYALVRRCLAAYVSPIVVDALLTNFHLPKTTLLMLVSAFAGVDFLRQGYEVAVQQRYRFYSYGDAMFIVDRRM